MKDYTIIDIFEDKIVFPSKTYTVGDKGIPWLKINFKYLFGLQTLNGLKIEVKYDLPKGFILDEYSLDTNNSTEFSINPSVFSASGWVKIFITLKKDINNLITIPGEVSLRVRNLNIDNNEVTPVYEVLIEKAVESINSKISEAISVANKKIEEIKSTEGMIGPQGPQGIQGLKGDSGRLINIADNADMDMWLGTQYEFDLLPYIEAGTKYDIYSTEGLCVGGRYWKNSIPNKYYDSRISIVLDINSRGLHLWNIPSDQILIKTINMAGLQKWEETDDYIIYLDKDAVMTTVAQYVASSYDKFMELKANVDSSMELLKINGIDWTAEDDSKLFIDINDSMLEEIKNTPVQLDKDEQVVQTFASKAVPTTYECCFRVDKKSGEIYNGEGYENLFSFDGIHIYNSNKTKELLENGDIRITTANIVTPHKDPYAVFILVAKLKYDTPYQIQSELVDYSLNKDDVFEGFAPDVWTEGFKHSNGVIYAMTRTKKQENGNMNNNGFLHRFKENQPVGTYSTFRKTFICVTSTPKPYVKSVMPNGKLSFVTETNETTHTFLNKGDGVVTFETGSFSLKGERVEQLLVYKGILTQAEKDLEMSKNIRLK